jgi:hypothetical protein
MEDGSERPLAVAALEDKIVFEADCGVIGMALSTIMSLVASRRRQRGPEIEDIVGPRPLRGAEPREARAR